MENMMISMDQESLGILREEKAKGIPYSACVRLALRKLRQNPIVKNNFEAPPMYKEPEIDRPLPGKVLQNRAMNLLKRLESDEDVSQADVVLFVKSIIEI